MHMEASAFRVTRMATSAAKLRYLMQQHLLETETLWLLTPQNAMELSRGSPQHHINPRVSSTNACYPPLEVRLGRR